ncbi:MAG: EAL domain-containing protein [Gammaproteobacteria bacterium]|nr:EAL domain-containing protein [Gammaproteobacteria bacterium]
MPKSRSQDSIPVGRWVFNTENNTLHLTENAFKIIGLSKNDAPNLLDVLNQTIQAPEDGLSFGDYFISRVRQGQRSDLEARFKRSHGGEGTLLISFEQPKLTSKSTRHAGYIQDVSQFKHHQERLIHSESIWDTLTQNTADIIMHVDYDGRILFINYPLPEHTKDGVINMSMYDFLPREQQYDIERCLNYVKQTGEKDMFNVDFPDPEENIRHFEAHVSAFKDSEQGKSAIVVVRDVTKRRKAEIQMEKLSRALENTADTVLITDLKGDIEYVNRSFEHMTGYKSGDLIGQSITSLSCDENDFYARFLSNMADTDQYNDISQEKSGNSNALHVQKTVTTIRNRDAEPTHYVAIGKDITEHMLNQEKLQHMATHDALTQLPNRSLFYDRLEQALSRAHWHNRFIAVLFVDIDGFKFVNDTLGHDTGDQLLIKISSRMQKVVRSGDTVARLGGDEFAILLDDIASEEDISKLAQKIIDSMRPKFVVDTQSLHITASVGVSLYPNDSDRADVLLKNADMAMYRAKHLGKNNYQYYSKDMSARAFERLNLENSLHIAIQENQLEVYYQPQYNFRLNKIVAMEALLRWNHPALGVILPNTFLHLLEETSMIVDVGKWVLDQACAQAKSWHRLGFSDLVMCVNFSSRQFSDHNLVDTIESALERHNLEPNLFEIEITESLLINNVKNIADSLNSLCRYGVRLALDDFGTGYSSLSYLKRFPIKKIKIDRSFIHDVCKDSNDAQITRAIIAMSEMLNVSCVAEGVETQEQLDFLLENNCDVVQGFHLREPQPAAVITDYINESLSPAI